MLEGNKLNKQHINKENNHGTSTYTAGTQTRASETIISKRKNNIVNKYYRERSRDETTSSSPDQTHFNSELT